MKALIKILLLGFITNLLVLINNETRAQDTKNNLYFLVDTINSPKNQRIVSINKARPLALYENKYEFFCKCLPPYKKNLTFFYINTKINSNENILKTIPDHQYLSWQELAILIEKNQSLFDQKYNLHIVEVLPRDRYQINLVKLEKYTTVQ